METVRDRKSKRSSKASRRTKEDTFVPDVAQVVASAAVQAPPKEKKHRVRKVEVDPPVVDEPKKRSRKVEVVAEEVAPAEVEVDISAVPSTSRRGAVSREELEVLHDRFIAILDAELEGTRSEKNRHVGVKTWRNLLKEAKALKGVSLKATKKTKKTSLANTKSGFMKPVKISREMASFAGWDESELKSRVDVTKYICKYIKDNDLQNPEDKRQIIADSKLSDLLDYNETDEKDLTYPYLQKKIQRHFK